MEVKIRLRLAKAILATPEREPFVTKALAYLAKDAPESSSSVPEPTKEAEIVKSKPGRLTGSKRKRKKKSPSKLRRLERRSYIRDLAKKGYEYEGLERQPSGADFISVNTGESLWRWRSKPSRCWVLRK